MSGRSGVTVLFVDDEENVLRAIRRLFMEADYGLVTAMSGEEGLEILGRDPAVRVVVSDYRMPGMNGVDFLRQVHERWPETVRLVLSGYADTAVVLGAINEGRIYKFIPKPWNDEELKITVDKAVDLYLLEEENRRLTIDLGEANRRLSEMNENLEEMVRSRTGELLFQNQLLEQARRVLDALPMGVVGVDDQGEIAQCNHRAAEILGVDQARLLGRRLGEFLEPGVAKALERSPLFQAEILGRLLRIRRTPFRLNGEKKGMILVFDEMEEGHDDRA